MELVDIAEAAQRLDISPYAVRRRIRSGQLRGTIWLVAVEDSSAAVTEKGTGAEAETAETSEREVDVLTELVDVLQAQVATLQQQLDSQATMFQTQLDRRETELEARRREVAELHVLLQQAQHQLPARTEGHRPPAGGRRRFWPWGGKTT